MNMRRPKTWATTEKTKFSYLFDKGNDFYLYDNISCGNFIGLIIEDDVTHVFLYLTFYKLRYFPVVSCVLGHIAYRCIVL